MATNKKQIALIRVRPEVYESLCRIAKHTGRSIAQAAAEALNQSEIFLEALAEGLERAQAEQVKTFEGFEKVMGKELLKVRKKALK